MSLRRYVGAAVRRIPLAEGYLRRRHLRNRFAVELSLIEGTHVNTNAHPSILHFSMNKAATQYTKSVLRRCAIDNGMVAVGIHDYAFHSHFPYLDHLSAAEMQQYQHVFKPAGYLYSVFGGMIDGIANLDRYKVVLMVRDPRDVLVSSYYSVAYSHPEPLPGSGKRDDFLAARETARRSGVDDYALAEGDGVARILERYKTLLLDAHSSAYVTRYEEMTVDFDGWLDGLLRACGLTIGDDLRRAIRDEHARLTPRDEDARRHIRKGRAGDFREKLKPQSIDALNARLGPMLEAFGYAEDGARRAR
jgi:Sulfotransferase domain